jgi:multiple sugar transport system permease protein
MATAGTHKSVETRGARQVLSHLGQRLRRVNVLRALVLTVAIVIFSIFTLFPFVWMALTSIRGDMLGISDAPFHITYDELTLSHYRNLLTETKFLLWMRNSILISTGSSVIAIVLGLLAAYSLGRLRYKGGGVAALVIFATYLLPPALLFIPLSVVVRRVGLKGNSLWTLIVVYLTFLVPFIAWMLSSYFKGIPRDLLDAARIDGASRLQAMILVDIPLVLPGVVSVFFFTFTLSWNEYLYAFTFINQASKLPIAVGVVNALQVGDVYYWGELMAGALIGSIPVVIIYSFLMDYYLAGMTAGAIKG